jgi:hypothetical protein
MASLSTEQRLAALEASIASLNMTTLEKIDALHPENVPDSGDTAWILTSTALVLMMTIPGSDNGLFSIFSAHSCAQPSLIAARRHVADAPSL